MTDAVIVTHNSADDLRAMPHETIDAFRRVVAVDSGSTDESVELLRDLGAEVLARPNEGFGAAVNEGVKLTEGQVFAVMNPDIRFRNTTVVSAMIGLFDADPRLAVAAPALQLPDGTIQDSARTVPTPVNIIRRRWADRRSGMLPADDRTPVPWVVGACVFIRRTAFDDVGGFDPAFFLYFEDVDLCVRLRRRGWRVVLEPSCVVVHEHRGDSRGSLTGWATRRHIESSLRFWRKHPDCAAGLDERLRPTRSVR